MDEIDKKLKFKRDLEKLRAAAVKSSDYSSPLDKEILKARGELLEKEEPIRIKGTTEKIDTRSGMKLTKGDEFSEKIAKLRAERKASMGSKFNKTKSKMMPDIPGLSVGLDLLQGNTEEAADTVAEDVLQSAPSMIAKGIGKIAPKAAGLALKAANPLGMLIGEALGSEKAGEGSDKMLEDSQERDVELTRDISEDDQLNQTRLRALQRMLKN